jgi:ribose transport system ATP-binding protein
VLSKWLFRDAKILIFDEPTRGIDVGTKSEIYQLMNELVNRGVGIIMISAELNEILGMSDRVIVMRKGRIAGEVSGDQTSEEQLVSIAMGVENNGTTK